MATETLNYTIPAGGGNPAVSVSATLTVTNGVLTGISGTYTANGVPETITGVIPPGGFEGNDNDVTLGGTPFVTGNGISFTVSGAGDDGLGHVNFYSSGTTTYAEDFANGNNSNATTATLTAACYARGTMILTDRGEVAVEDLVIGDKVVTFDGASEPIQWIGHRTYADRFLRGQRHLLPILIRNGALSDNVPSRDLSVSPAHAMFIAGVLVPASHLVNGSTIVQDMEAESVQYFHVELAAHRVMWANGAASETFVDDESRQMFHNAAEHAALYPAVEPQPAVFCAPRVTDGFELEAIREAIDARARTAVRKAA